MLIFLDIFNAMYDLIWILIFMGGISYFISSYITLILCSLYKTFFKKAAPHQAENLLQIILIAFFTSYLAYEYCSDSYPTFASAIASVPILVSGFVIAVQEIKKRKQQYRKSKPSVTTSTAKPQHHCTPTTQPGQTYKPSIPPSSSSPKKNYIDSRLDNQGRKVSTIKRSQSISFDIAFASQIGQDPTSYICNKLNSGSHLDAIRYLFQIIEAEIEKKRKCKSPGFDFYYAKAINRQARTQPLASCSSYSHDLNHIDLAALSPQNSSISNDPPCISPAPFHSKDSSTHHSSYIHDTLKGEKVKSYDEAVIANMLYRERIDYEYERIIQLEDHFVRPDFSIPLSSDGDMIYWEHCGMLSDPEYRANWKQKKEAYKKYNIIEGKNLIVTSGTDPNKLNHIIAEIQAKKREHSKSYSS